MSNSNFNQPLILKPKSSVEENIPGRRKFSKLKLFFIVLGLVVLGFLIYFSTQVFFAYKTVNASPSADQILTAVNKIMVLPTDETPIIKTVTTLDNLNYQPFFMNAAVGDQTIIYEKARKAILYRPSTNQIIQTASLQ